MKSHSIDRLVICSLLIGLTGGVQAGDNSGEKFRAKLSGAAEVPSPVDTDTRGEFRLAYDATGGTARYRLRLRDGVRVFMSHIHCGLEGENGPIVAWLAGAPVSPAAWDVDGKWIDNAVITDADIVPGTGCGDTVDQLVETLRFGGAYVNVHSRGNPAGEVRGQIRPSDDDA